MKFWYFETLFVALFVVLIFSSGTNLPFDNPQYVPEVVTGLATISGTLTAFTGYLLSHLLRKLIDTPKKWIGMRVAIIIMALGFGLIFVMFGLQELVYGSFEGAYNGAQFGSVLILLAFFEVMFMIIIRELEQTTNLAGDL